MRNAKHATCREGYAHYVRRRNLGAPTGNAFLGALDDLGEDVVLPTQRSHVYWHRLYKQGYQAMPVPMNRGEALLGGSPFDEGPVE